MFLEFLPPKSPFAELALASEVLTIVSKVESYL